MEGEAEKGNLCLHILEEKCRRKVRLRVCGGRSLGEKATGGRGDGPGIRVAQDVRCARTLQEKKTRAHGYRKDLYKAQSTRRRTAPGQKEGEVKAHPSKKYDVR